MRGDGTTSASASESRLVEAYIVDWLSLVVRWLHFVTGVAWIGSSFYFVWLDNHLLPVVESADEEKGVGGEIWSVHGGGFYHAQKYRVAPQRLPATLHWFKWEAYTTWISGMLLLALVYWYGAEIYLIDQSVAELRPPIAIGVGLLFLVGGWIVYDLLCKSPLGKHATGLALTVFLLLIVAAWSLCSLFSGRGAFIHFGAMLGSIMVANVFFVIIPGQRRMVQATQEGRSPDPADSIAGKQRSVHNTYFTLPLLFIMISNHYAVTYGHTYNWLVLIGFLLAGALIRVYFVARHKGKASPIPLLAGIAVLLAIAALISPRSTLKSVGSQDAGYSIAAPGAIQSPATFANVAAVIRERCTTCHSSQPNFAGFPSAPSGVVLDTPGQIAKEASRIHQQVVLTRIMPIGNLTDMNDEERVLIDHWFRDGAAIDWVQQH